MSISFYQSKSDNPWWNQSVEKYLADHIEKSDVVFYLWQNREAVFIGRNQNPMRECRAYELEDNGGCLARRTTGGGAVYHDLGNLCFTFAASPEMYDLKRQMGVIQDACERFGIKTCLSGRNDIMTEAGHKFSGNAFSRSSRFCVHHGTIMVDVDTKRMAEILTPSRAKMKMKGVESIHSRVCNLRELNPDVTVRDMCKALESGFGECYGEYTKMSQKELNRDELLEIYEDFSSWEWRYGKTPGCKISLEHKFDWGEVQIGENLEEMYIRDLEVYTDALDVELPALLKKLLVGKRFDMEDADVCTLTDASEEQKEKIHQVITWLKEEI